MQQNILLNSRRLLALLLLTVSALCFAGENTAPTTDQYAAVTSNGYGAIATVNPIATQAGMNAYAEGGNAIDAAIAAALTLGVVDGYNSGIGGGCFALIRWADGSVQAWDGREMAPAAAHRDMYLVEGKADLRLSQVGPLAIGIPGSVAVYERLNQQGGKLDWPALVLPAARIAANGFPINAGFAARLANSADQIRQFPGSAEILLDKQGKPLTAGTLLIQKDLAATYRHLADEGSHWFYHGEFAKKASTWILQHGGIVSEKDFATYQLKIRKPVVSQYHDYTIYGFPPPSSGGVHVAQILNILEPYPLPMLTAADRQHILAEAMKLAFADRAEWLGDPDFALVPRGLLDKTYASSLRKQISMDRIIPNVTHGTPPAATENVFSKHTTHIAAADKDGNWVAITTTVNTSFGSKVIIPGTGVIMNNQMDDFSIQPGVPNAFGLIGNEANSLQPRKRPLSSMSPTIVVQNGKPVLTLGAAGGPTIISQVVQGIINRLDLNLSLHDALAAPRIHHQWQPNDLLVENTLDEDVQKELTARGHLIKPMLFFGSTQAIGVDSHGKLVAHSEPRLMAR